MKQFYAAVGLLFACSSSSSLSKQCDPPCSSGYKCLVGQCSAGGTTPQETLQYFSSALKSNNLEKAIQYFSLHRQGMAKEALSSRNLPELAAQLEQAPKEEGLSTGKFRETHFQMGDKVYTITFHCSENGLCKIISL